MPQSNHYHAGFRYGVMLNDGSVLNNWNGSSQREQALAAFRKISTEYARDNIRFVRRRIGSTEWEEFPAKPLMHITTEWPDRHKRNTRH